MSYSPRGGSSYGSQRRSGSHSFRGKSNASRSEMLNFILETNSPEQIKSGKMSPEDWADTYMSSDSDFVLMDVSPKAMFMPLSAGDNSKVENLSKSEYEFKPIVIDSNEKIQARIGGGVLDRVGGLQPYTVLDGKHRVSASLIRGDKSIKAYVPKSAVDEVLKRSHKAEVFDAALDYIKEKGYEIREKTADGYKIFDPKRNSTRVIDEGVLDVVKRNRGESWLFKK